MPSTGPSIESVRASVRTSRALTTIALVLALISMILTYINWPSVYKIPYESTGPGVIRYYSNDLRMIIHENALGYMKVLTPTCSKQFGVWPHMQATIKYHWVPYNSFHEGTGPEHGEECYQLDNVKRLGPDTQ